MRFLSCPRLTRRLSVAVATVVTAVALLLSATSAAAHSVGTPARPGATLPTWTDPLTHAVVIGDILFADADAVHIEDLTGRLHVWPVRALSGPERAAVARFTARVAAVNGAPTPRGPSVDKGRPEVDTPVGALRIWGWALASLAIGWLLLGWRRTGLVPRVPVLLALASLPLACAGTTSTNTTTSPSTTPSGGVATGGASPSLLAAFNQFSSRVRTRQDARYLYVESDGLADGPLMVGIRSWQQQVPLPAAYTGSNAWSVPVAPQRALTPVSAKTALYSGAIALAVNGVPIFNALNNRGDDAYLAGELDAFGGHAGRADDYHYHTAPLFLSSTVGATSPIGVGLDGYLLYGDAEPDGAGMRPLDTLNGHDESSGGYHYHGTRTYPYINGGMRGAVTVVNDRIEPQPSLQPVRPAQTPLNGAVITAFAQTASTAWSLQYEIAGRPARVDYRVSGGVVTYTFTDTTGAVRTETYGK